ncbi:MAG: hypothetical protein Q7U97_16935 [Rhodocyclaceae bacterium]|nr:hypothetical protein [Rhodocyclaceae bacterium]
MLAVLTLSYALPANADIDESAYEAVGAVRTERERRRLQQQFETDTVAERRRAQTEEAALARAIADEKARDAARPYAERLTRQQCTLCHSAENYAAKRHTWLYWRLVVARMVWLNDAPIARDAQNVIAGHLAMTYSAHPQERLVEYGLPVAELTLAAGMVWAGQRLVAGWRRRTGRGP